MLRIFDIFYCLCYFMVLCNFFLTKALLFLRRETHFIINFTKTATFLVLVVLFPVLLNTLKTRELVTSNEN